MICEKKTGQIEFIFLDGDFALEGNVNWDGYVELKPKNPEKEFVWNIALSEVEKAVKEAAEYVVNRMESVGLRPRGIEGVEKGIKQLSK